MLFSSIFDATFDTIPDEIFDAKFDAIPDAIYDAMFDPMLDSIFCVRREGGCCRRSGHELVPSVPPEPSAPLVPQ